MCRFTLYLGPPIKLSTLLTEPSHSLIRQSYEAEERAEPLNGDGFGVGWYAPDVSELPGLFRSVTPAWNDRNLVSLARVVCSPCIFAHVRAATPGMAVGEANCHPFQWRHLIFMHNGHLGAFGRVRRELLAGLSDEAFDLIGGSTDTEHLFALFVDELLRDGGLEEEPGPCMARCLDRAVRRALKLVEIHGDGAHSNLNLAVSDGDHAVVTRFTDYPDQPPESLYFIPHALYEPVSHDRPARRMHEDSGAVVVASERLTDDPEWRAVPPNHLMVVDRGVDPVFHPMAAGALEVG